ncbi:YceI family protein [Mycobacterium paragordonae]|uniref:YceI family protein n=1 Tax=Mycobacterium paragordonae TaxID=1389713 RepID=A0A386U2V6_9MYCO|nr:YceI family protein [Mycobacterium paragordonae]AYE94765.1 YceI family protein [Mycobacterium paragordonae]MDP7736395.1 YceI family protein [Mycobacterium paragordonae]TDK96960.1 YceI family protein [Mycobacterium paragordonae]TDK99495.1 YceI family protein [Mycobacterium paragordonae]TDL06153.1 YceI family protein [Mycobacterium paragordonae]
MTTLETLLSDPESVGTWALAPDRSAVTFKIRNMWGLMPVKGSFTEFSGEGRLAGKGAVSGRIDIQVASLDTGIARRDKHLRSPDFFDVERFSQITVVVNALHPANGKSADLHTNFTIKGITEPVPLPVTITELDDGSVRISGQTQIDRSRFDLGWNKLGVMSNAVVVSADAVFVHSAQTA